MDERDRKKTGWSRKAGRTRRPDGARRPDGTRKPNRQNVSGAGRNTANRKRRKKRSRRRRQRSLILGILVLIILAVGILGSTLVWKKYGPSKARADLKEYYGITSEDQLAVVVNNEILESKGMEVNGQISVLNMQQSETTSTVDFTGIQIKFTVYALQK